MPKLCPQCKTDFLTLRKRTKSTFTGPDEEFQVYVCENCGYESKENAEDF